MCIFADKEKPVEQQEAGGGGKTKPPKEKD